MGRILTAWLGASLVVLVVAGTVGVAAQSPAASVAPDAKPGIRIGSDNFYESKLVAEIYAQALESMGYPVTRSLGLGTRPDRAPAFEQGQVDLVPEYVGSGLGYYDASRQTADGEQNRANLQAVFDAMDGLATVLSVSPGQDRNAAAVRPDTAAQYDLSTMSDLAAVQDELVWGLPSDCDTNALCAGAFKAYGIVYPPKQRETLAACDVPMGVALANAAIDVGWFCETQPAIAQYGFVRLEDDKGQQPADNLVAIVRNDYLARVGDVAGFKEGLDGVTARITTDALTLMGVDVAVNQEDIPDVAKAFLAGAYGTAAPGDQASPAASPVG
jgi:osmoprotectant transport system substrate-binding protein